MILADTTIWVDHLRKGEPGLVALLNDSRVLIHPVVIGELACGNLPDRDAVLGLLGSLPVIPPATDYEVLFFIEQRQVMGRGIGYVDAHLLASATLAQSVQFWTRDRRLLALASDLGLAYKTSRARSLGSIVFPKRPALCGPKEEGPRFARGPSLLLVGCD